eukprot:TRINITY_DN4463_c0_g1_i1.p1 TRINITY_DN4463_c0_g1~~TRINITY_DN4463_c0_g1_i1.p1  ORF type:complete len:225 (+),score=51.70 TRINITY_DN4463_c0_g1_i1:179-853(+)
MSSSKKDGVRGSRLSTVSVESRERRNSVGGLMRPILKDKGKDREKDQHKNDHSKFDTNKASRVLQMFTEAERQELRDLFNLVDLDKGGTIDADEWGKLLKTIGITSTQEELKQMVKEIDVDGDGVVSFNEFVWGMTRYKKDNPSEPAVQYSADELRKAFELFRKRRDRDLPPGNIYLMDLVDALSEYGAKGKKLSRQEAFDLVQQLDPEGLGIVNYQQIIMLYF